MKKLIVFGSVLILIGFALLSKGAPGATPTAWNTIFVTNASTSVPTNFTAGVSATTNIYATFVTILGKASPRSVNTSTCYIGTTIANDTQVYPVTAGGEVILRAPENTKFNLKDWYVDVLTVNDGVTIVYQ